MKVTPAKKWMAVVATLVIAGLVILPVLAIGLSAVLAA